MTLVPAAAKGTHLLLVQMGGVVVEFCLGPASEQTKKNKKKGCLLLRSKHSLASLVLTRHCLLNNTYNRNAIIAMIAIISLI